ncbi:ligand-gated channel [Bacteroidia bacterium]|nr:ligand-gated channel [Bacteroidia bacterium]
MNKKILFIPLFLAAANAVQAQDSTSLSTRKIDEVIVTGARSQITRNNVPSAISVVNRDIIEQSSEPALLNALQGQVPGLFITQRGVSGFGVSSGAAGGITLRGVGSSSSSQVLVLIDGHPQYMGIMGHPMPDAYRSQDVEQVEVVRGPASVLYGSNAMGGAINLITRKQNTDGWNINGSAAYGSYNTQNYGLSIGAQNEKFDGYASFSSDYSDGHRPNAAFASDNFYGRLGWNLSPHFRLWGEVNYARYTVQDPGVETAPELDSEADIARREISFTVENKYEKIDGALKLFLNNGVHTINDGHTADKPASPFLFRSQDHNIGVLLYQNLRLFKGNVITAGIDYKRLGGLAENDFFENGVPTENLVDKVINETAGYLTVQQTLFTKLTLNAGARFEHSSAFGNEWVPQAGVTFQVFRNTLLKGSVAKGYRSPTLAELYYKAAWMGANPDLTPERMWNYDISVEQFLLNKKLSLELTGFVADGENIIQREGAYPDFRNQNSGTFNNKGVEFAVKWNALKGLYLHGTYAYLHTQKPILYAPQQQANVSAHYTFKMLSLHLGYQYVKDVYSAIGTTPAQSSYGLLNARVGLQPIKHLTIFVKGENLTDANYTIIAGYPMPGATVMGGVSINL